MKEDIKDRWVGALRSGEYKQGKGRLKTSDGNFCCLGVLCDLYLLETGGSWQLAPDDKPCMRDEAEEEGYGNWSVLPSAVQDWAGLEFDDPTVLTVKAPIRGRALSKCNDMYDEDFEQIATWIEVQF